MPSLLAITRYKVSAVTCGLDMSANTTASSAAKTGKHPNDYFINRPAATNLQGPHRVLIKMVALPHVQFPEAGVPPYAANAIILFEDSQGRILDLSFRTHPKTKKTCRAAPLAPLFMACTEMGGHGVLSFGNFSRGYFRSRGGGGVPAFGGL